MNKSIINYKKIKKTTLTMLLLPLLFSTCSKDDLDLIDPTDPTAYDYRLEKITTVMDGVGVMDVDYEYNDILKRYSSAERIDILDDLVYEEINFEYNSDGTVTEEQQDYNISYSKIKTWKPNSNGGWNIIMDCNGEDDNGELRCDNYIYYEDLLIETERLSGEIQTVYFYDNNTLISDSMYHEDELFSWSVYTWDGNVETMIGWSYTSWIYDVDPIMTAKTEKTWSGDNLMKEENFLYNDEEEEFELVVSFTYTYKPYEAFSPPGFNGGPAIDKIILTDADGVYYETEYHYTDL